MMFLNFKSFFGVAKTSEVKQFINSFRSLWKYTEIIDENESMRLTPAGRSLARSKIKIKRICSWIKYLLAETHAQL